MLPGSGFKCSTASIDAAFEWVFSDCFVGVVLVVFDRLFESFGRFCCLSVAFWFRGRGVA